MPTVQVRSQFVPIPLLGVISPWNAPLMMSLMDAVPALLAGCAAIIKPSEVTPRFVGPIMETIRTVPDVAEVLTYVVGDGVTGQQIIENVDVVCFTGSVTNGRKVGEACARRFIPAFLELGGKDPVIVTASADVKQAAKAIVRGAVYNTGQVCYSIERVYAHEAIHDALVAALVEEAGQVELNYPDEKHGTHRAIHLRAAGGNRGSASRRCARARREADVRREERESRRRPVHAPDRADERDARDADHAGRDVRARDSGDGLSHGR
jgi:acyl-CoA reductase-like NAD-dependent aldehyde dehydrogenase